METVESNFLNLEWTEFDLKLKDYATQNHIPILVDEGLAFIENILRIQKPKKILEIGTAIGYSAIRMAKICDSQIITIEKSAEMFFLAKQNVLESKIKTIQLINADALEAFNLVKEHSFDFIFIDAAKAQYQKFFEIYSPLLTSNGIIISDNMNFHGLVEENMDNLSKSVKGLVRKLLSYKKFLIENKNFYTSIFNIGDGLAISIKKETICES